MKIVINGIECEAQYGEYLLETARRNNIDIPTLCHDEALSGQACCRYCIVEVIANNRRSVVTSCVYPVTCEIEVETNSEKIRNMRKTILMLLSARAPQSKVIQEWARVDGVSAVTRFSGEASEECILCNLCVEACDRLGKSAISTVNRGISKKVATPFEEPSLSCIGCTACANICPTGAIKVYEKDHVRTIWNREFALVACVSCGELFATAEQLAYYNAKLNVGLDEYQGNQYCEACRQKKAVELSQHVVTTG